ncbi:hypothetical protein [Actinomadura sp. DC4]|uniref:hypothetical protein n=1 Tax=Actinomadura sp. DC4 TaxID=3055069 RepID=UPI0025B0E7B0|nr:hypothetical protein [Actinomadura sp. DC4]MDN3359006.1 hypothetical protein [Actinomadura sp. DC4]
MASQDERIAYRSHAVWFWPVFWPVAIALRWFLGWDAGGPMVLWIPGIALLETNAILTALRARRGLTLAADEITWHKYEMRLSWSNVTAVEQRGRRLVVRVGEPGQALEDVALPARPEVHANLRRFGAPIAVRAGRLARPAAEVVEIAGRLREAYEPSSGLKGFLIRDTPPEQERARRSARLWITLASLGLGVVLFGAVIVNIVPSSPDPEIAFVFKRTTGPGYIDQVLHMTNYGLTATAPTLGFVPLDRAGHVLPGVTVRTAYGSDRGLVVLPPRSPGIDVLAFDGPGFRDVADVRVTVRHRDRLRRPASAAEELHARRLLGTRFTEAPQDFDTLLLHNTNGVAVTVRMVCILWEDPPPGAAQQMLRSLPIGGLVSIAAFDEIRVPVTGPVRSLARGCGSVKVYYSRPAPPVGA